MLPISCLVSSLNPDFGDQTESVSHDSCATQKFCNLDNYLTSLRFFPHQHNFDKYIIGLGCASHLWVAKCFSLQDKAMFLNDYVNWNTSSSIIS